MDEMNGNIILSALLKKWMACTVLADLFISFGMTFLLDILVHKFFNWSYWWAVLFFPAVFFLLFFLHRLWTINEKAIAQLLDQTYPQLEESSGLLLKSLYSLNLLERLQYNRTKQALSRISAPLKIFNRLLVPVCILGITLLMGIIIYNVPFTFKAAFTSIQGAPVNTVARPEIILPQIAGISISITPPVYTAKHIRQQQTFNLVAEEGSVINWQLQTNIAASQVKFIFNDGVQAALTPAGVNHTQWHLTKKIDSTGFYQVNIDGNISELYKIETIKDRPPVVLLQSPKEYTTIDFGEPQQVKVTTTISDDYGVADAFVSATIASGSGEAVKFKEQKIGLPGFVARKTQYQLQQLLLLPKLGIQPGDELYFYVQATDNHQQQTRSDVYIVHLPDTAQLMSLDGMANNLSLKPEYFRSERQIIIETAQLLKDKDTISAETFKNKSNNLGIDQKLLRLRYGKFLGDESESGENDTHDLGDISNFSDAEKIKDAYTDKHDNAEDATFYEPETKKQLRATLTEMWAAEMRLRTFTPQTALPFEYKALRLLKDLQEKSRAYVAKTNLKTTPLDLKKRLTGDLTKIDPSILQKDIQLQPEALQPVRNALAVLEEIKAGNIQNISAAILQQANLRLYEKAIQQPALYLNAVEALKKVMAGIGTSAPVSPENLLGAERGLQQLLQVPARLPSAVQSSPGQALSKLYFDNLQKKQP